MQIAWARHLCAETVYFVFAIRLKVLVLWKVYNDWLMLPIYSCLEYLEINVTCSLLRNCALRFEITIENWIVGRSRELELKHLLEYLLFQLANLFVGKHLIFVHNLILACAWDSIMVLQVGHCFSKLL